MNYNNEAKSLIFRRGSEVSQVNVNPKKLETGLRTSRAGIPCAVFLRVEGIGVPTLGLLL